MLSLSSDVILVDGPVPPRAPFPLEHVGRMEQQTSNDAFKATTRLSH